MDNSSAWLSISVRMLSSISFSVSLSHNGFGWAKQASSVTSVRSSTRFNISVSNRLSPSRYTAPRFPHHAILGCNFPLSGSTGPLMILVDFVSYAWKCKIHLVSSASVIPFFPRVEYVPKILALLSLSPTAAIILPGEMEVPIPSIPGTW